MKLSTRPLVFLASLVLAVLLAVGPVPQPLGRNAAVVLVTLALWSTGLVPPFLTSLIFFAAVLIPGLAPPDLVFAGFGSAAVWLIVSGFVIGAAITGSGLGGRIAGVLAPLAGGSYLRLVAVMTLAAMALGFVMPSSVGRAVVLVPVGMALAERLGLHKGSNGRIGLAVALTLACNMPSFAILPSNIPNMILAGAAEGQHGVTFGYMSYLLLHYPVLGIAKSALTVALIVALFPDRIEAGSAEATPRAPLSPQERRVALILAATLALWMTDRLHGVGPAWIGIATAALLLMPGLGAVPPKQFNASVDFGMVLFVAGALALGAVVNASGLGSVLGGVLQDWLPLHQGASFVNFLSLTSMSGLMGLVTTNPGVPTVLTPMAPDLAAATGLSLKAVLMTQVVGFATVIFPYQVGPLVLAMQLSGEKLGHVLRITVPLAVLTFLVLMPLDWLWWRLLGWL
ncbi:SLC13 family permease [Paracoccus sp. pheM1]|uniref:SLC13 family permease n=1 Tax=Paracoccus sp. pheM1 TaxID=2831675 RepID=UPI001BDB85F8|nr:SLC13 family permease [Paracoccus sp. pheM1]MBT0779992.1 anion permease [Paracoccus sp. pheM1]